MAAQDDNNSGKYQTFLIFGAPGSGKGTQEEYLKKFPDFTIVLVVMFLGHLIQELK